MNGEMKIYQSGYGFTFVDLKNYRVMEYEELINEKEEIEPNAFDENGDLIKIKWS